MPIFSSDALHGIPGLSIILPVYRVVSFEMLAATISWVTRLTPLESHHWVLAALFGGLAPLAHARVMQTWTPRTWLYGTAASLFVLLTMTGPARSFGNTTLVLLHQGKGAFLAVMAPLVLAYAAEFARAPGPRTWGLLFLSQIACVGMTATALWVAPAIAVLSMLAVLPWAWRSAPTLAVGVLASAHPLLGGAAAIGIAIGLGACTTPFFLHSSANAPRFEFLGLKVKPNEFAAALAVVTQAGPSRRVLVPEPVSVWIGTLRDHPVSVLPRRLYLDILRPSIGEDEFEWRTKLAFPVERAIDRRWRLPPSWTPQLREHAVSTVCLARSAHGFRELGAALMEAGFEPVDAVPGYVIGSRHPAKVGNGERVLDSVVEEG